MSREGIIGHAVFTVVVAVIFYLSGAAASASWNIADFNEWMRGMFAVLWGLISVGQIIVFKANLDRSKSRLIKRNP